MLKCCCCHLLTWFVSWSLLTLSLLHTSLLFVISLMINNVPESVSIVFIAVASLCLLELNMNSLLWIQIDAAEHERLACRLSTVELRRALQHHCADYARYSYFSCAFYLVFFSLVIYADIKIQCSADNCSYPVHFLAIYYRVYCLHNYWRNTS